MEVLDLIGGLFIVLIGLFFLFVALTSLLSVVSGAQFVESPSAVFEDIFKLAKLGPTDRFLELGSGMGTLCCFVAKRTTAQVVGIDINPLLTFYAGWKARGLSNARFRVGNAHSTDITHSDVIYCYMLPPLLRLLTKRFDHELPKGTRVISYGFPLPGKEPIQTIPRAVGRGALFVYQY